MCLEMALKAYCHRAVTYLVAKLTIITKYIFDLSLNLPYITIHITTMFHLLTLLTIKSERHLDY